MYRYLVLVWNPADERARLAALACAERLAASSTGWVRVLDCDGVTVWHDDRQLGASRTVPLANSSGVVLGRILSRDIHAPETAARVSFDEAESSHVVGSGGRRLLERYWGRYVAVIRDGASGEVSVLRDPLGGFPCLLTRHEGVHVLCSDLQDCEPLGVRPFTVNWNYIAGFVAYAALQIRDTALNEVSEVQPGERVSFHRGVISRTVEWNPIDIARSAPLDSVDAAVTSLRATTVGCVHTWAACYGGIVHNLSGGLDSSIVLSCLASAPTRPGLVCLNHFGTGPNEDERRYARMMAQRVGVDLIERQLDPREVRLERLSSLRPTPRPWFYMYEVEHGGYEGDLARQHGAGSLFSGAGGDGVFFQAHADLALTDYLFAHGLGTGLLRTAVDAARVSRRSIWSLLAQALQIRLFGRRWDPIALAKPLPRPVVNADVIAAAKRNPAFVHPWFTPAAVRGAPPGILWHAMAVSIPPAFYSSFTRDPYPERTLPLLSQPLVELCLRIPTYLLIESGWDRALARRAFERDLPTQIVRRRAKGRVDQHMRNILDANLDFVREMLLDGLLVQHGLLDRRALELYLTRERSPADFQYGEILQEHLCTEAWLRSWITSSCSTAS